MLGNGSTVRSDMAEEGKPIVFRDGSTVRLGIHETRSIVSVALDTANGQARLELTSAEAEALGGRLVAAAGLVDLGLP